MTQPKRKLPTQHDIARALGVAQITVSRALSGHPSVTESLRERIFEEARRQGYRLNRSANVMRQGRQKAIGLLASDNVSTSATPVGIFWGLEDACFQRGLQLMIGRYPDAVLSDQSKLPQFLRHWMVDGMLLYYTHNIPRGLQDYLEKLKLPYVWINSNHPHAIKADDRAAAADLVHHLVKLGHRKVSLLGHRKPDEKEPHYSMTERIEGFRKAMVHHRLQPSVLMTEGTDPLHERVKKLVSVLVGDPTAFITMSRWDAMAITLAMAERGLHAPRDYSLATIDQSGFNNLGLNITTMQVPNQGLADAALERIEAMIREDKLPPLPRVPFDFDEGLTTGPAPQ